VRAEGLVDVVARHLEPLDQRFDLLGWVVERVAGAAKTVEGRKQRLDEIDMPRLAGPVSLASEALHPVGVLAAEGVELAVSLPDLFAPTPPMVAVQAVQRGDEGYSSAEQPDEKRRRTQEP